MESRYRGPYWRTAVPFSEASEAAESRRAPILNRVKGSNESKATTRWQGTTEDDDANEESVDGVGGWQVG